MRHFIKIGKIPRQHNNVSGTASTNGTASTATPTAATSSTSRSSSTDEEDNDAVSKEEKEKRLPLLTHLWQIVKLCSVQWKWFSAAYVLLFVDCICKCYFYFLGF